MEVPTGSGGSGEDKQEKLKQVVLGGQGNKERSTITRSLKRSRKTRTKTQEVYSLESRQNTLFPDAWQSLSRLIISYIIITNQMIRFYLLQSTRINHFINHQT
jgi:hypothetical protein